MSNTDMHILEEQAANDVINQKLQEEAIAETLTEENLEKLQQFYNNNPEQVEILGGLEIIESLLQLPDEYFDNIKNTVLDMYAEMLLEPQTREELMGMIAIHGYTSEQAEAEYSQMLEAIDNIDFLSESKKDLLKKMTIATEQCIINIIHHKGHVVQIPCEVLNGNLPPQYAHDTDAGMDIISPAEYTIAPGETIIVPTGIKCAIPEGYALLIQPRSGQSVKTKLRVANTPGLIDAGYRDEIGVIIENIEPPFKDIDYEFDDKGEIHIKSILHGESYTIAPGQRFAQMRLVQVPHANFVAVESVGEIGEDRQGGFGSTGN